MDNFDQWAASILFFCTLCALVRWCFTCEVWTLSLPPHPTYVAVLRSCSSTYWSPSDYLMTTLTLSFMCKSVPTKKGLIMFHHIILASIFSQPHTLRKREYKYIVAPSAEASSMLKYTVNVFFWVMTCFDCLCTAALQAETSRRVHEVLWLVVMMFFNNQNDVLKKRQKSVWLFRCWTSNMLYLLVMRGRIIHFFCFFWSHNLLCSCHSSLLFSGGGNVRIETVKLDFRDKAQAKVGSLENAHHTPGGGHIMVSASSAVWRTIRPVV